MHVNGVWSVWKNEFELAFSLPAGADPRNAIAATVHLRRMLTADLNPLVRYTTRSTFPIMVSYFCHSSSFLIILKPASGTY